MCTSRARWRISFSRSSTTLLATVLSSHCPLAERACRSTVTTMESERSARALIKAVMRSRSLGLPFGEYHSVTARPVCGSSESSLAKLSVSIVACHNSGLTPDPVCGPES